MDVFVKKINRELAIEVLNWQYEYPYDFYNGEVTTESMKELLEGSYHAIVDINQNLVGFFCSGCAAQVPAGNQVGAYSDDYIDVGFGMKPELTGNGNGFDFCSFVFQQIHDRFGNASLRLTVATFNKRAIRLYEKLGFVSDMVFLSNDIEFLTMKRA